MDRARMFARGVSLCALPVIFASLLSGCTHTKSLFSRTPPKVKADYIELTTGMEFVFVKGGTFQMGSRDYPEEQPIHNVTIQDLFVGMHEVTFNQYDQFCEATLREKPDDEGWGRGNRPAINVYWDEATAYAAWLSEQTGHQFRLPSESEWEYFARAGTVTEFWVGDTLTTGSANCRDCGSPWDNQQTAPVGSFPPNNWGLFDTAGNITEWVLDDYQSNYNDAPTDGTPLKLEKRSRKVQRGGAWSYSVHYLRSSTRDHRSPQSRNNDTGFRLILVPSEDMPIPHYSR